MLILRRHGNSDTPESNFFSEYPNAASLIKYRTGLTLGKYLPFILVRDYFYFRIFFNV